MVGDLEEAKGPRVLKKACQTLCSNGGCLTRKIYEHDCKIRCLNRNDDVWFLPCLVTMGISAKQFLYKQGLLFRYNNNIMDIACCRWQTKRLQPQ